MTFDIFWHLRHFPVMGCWSTEANRQLAAATNCIIPLMQGGIRIQCGSLKSARGMHHTFQRLGTLRWVASYKVQAKSYSKKGTDKALHRQNLTLPLTLLVMCPCTGICLMKTHTKALYNCNTRDPNVGLAAWKRSGNQVRVNCTSLGVTPL